jgi:pentatricopeptide repeat protein
VDGYCTLNNLDAVLTIPDELAKGGQGTSKALYRALIRRLCKKGFVDHAQKLVDQMDAKGVSGDGLVYTVLAFAYLREGKCNDAIQVLNEMVKKNLDISKKIYKSITASYADESDLLMMFWAHANEKGLLAKKVHRLVQNLKRNQNQVSY